MSETTTTDATTAPTATAEPTSTPNGQRAARILVIDDEAEIGGTVRTGLASAEFAVEWAQTGQDGIEQARQWRPDVIILDLGLPDMDGVEVVRAVRAWTETPIIVLSVRSGDQDKVQALNEGADDYLTKPFSMSELAARVRVALRHATRATGGAAPADRFEAGGLVIDFARRLVTVDGEPIHLTPTEYETLKYLAQNAGRVITHETLLKAVWGPQYENEAHYLRVFVGQIRRKIEPTTSKPRYILTEPGVGYRLRAPDGDGQ